MELNEDMLHKLKQLDDEQLRSVIAEVADALGASPSQKRRALNNAGFIRRKLGTSSGMDLSRQLDKLDPQTQNELLRKIKL